MKSRLAIKFLTPYEWWSNALHPGQEGGYVQASIWLVHNLRKQPSFFAPSPSGVSRSLFLSSIAALNGVCRNLRNCFKRSLDLLFPGTECGLKRIQKYKTSGNFPVWQVFSHLGRSPGGILLFGLSIRRRATGQGMFFWPYCPEQGIQFYSPLS